MLFALLLITMGKIYNLRCILVNNQSCIYEKCFAMLVLSRGAMGAWSNQLRLGDDYSGERFRASGESN